MQATDLTGVAKDAVALLGVPWDENSSFLRGPAEAPPVIREAIQSPSANSCVESGLDLNQQTRLVDVGDLDLAGCTNEQAFDRIANATRTIGKRGAKPLSIGGDHAATYPLVKGLADTHPQLTILHFDAHPDLYDELDGNRMSHACPFARILENQLATRLVQVGIRTMNPHQREQADRFGVEVFEMRNWRGVLDVKWNGPVYVSIDLDGLDPAFAPGVSHHEPGGLTTRELLEVLWQVDVPIVGGDVVELNPRRDLNGMTAMVAAKLVKELAACMLAR